MPKSTYLEESTRLSKAIDIAISSFIQYPPKEFKSNQEQLKHFIKVYQGFRDDVINPEPEYKNIQSLKHIENAAFTYFQEGTGETVDYFWHQIKKEVLGYKRQNKLTKILKRKKINTQNEYDFIIDVLVPYQQDGLLTEVEVTEINQYILDFEKRATLKINKNNRN